MTKQSRRIEIHTFPVPEDDPSYADVQEVFENIRAGQERAKAGEPTSGLPCLSPDFLWTFDIVEKRLVDAVKTYELLPDRERAWLRDKVQPVFREYIGEYVEGWDTETENRHVQPPKPTATRAALSRAEEAFEWLQQAGIKGNDMIAVSAGLIEIHLGYSQIRWTKVRERLKWTITTDAIRKKYTRSLARVAAMLNGDVAAMDRLKKDEKQKYF
jgi:hypothetical protein